MLEAFQRYWHADQEVPQFLLDAGDPEAFDRLKPAAAGAVLYHVLLVLFALNAPGGAVRRYDAPEILPDVRKATPLIAPRDVPEFRLTQKEPQRAKPAAEVDLAALLPKPEVRQAPRTPPGKPFVPPPGPTAAAAAPVLEAPKIEVAQGMPNLPAAPEMPKLPAPANPPKASPFESVSGRSGTAPAARTPGQPAIAPPKAGVEEAVKQTIRGGGGRGLVVGDTGAGGSGGISEGILQSASPQRTASALELMSDPQGVDFRPYLIQVLTAVKSNWMAVFPESARLGLAGRVVIQFSIDRTGAIPKLVIAVPSGAGALDRAAVAGITASRFPPLPVAFRGSEIRVQLVFTYNLPK